MEKRRGNEKEKQEIRGFHGICGQTIAHCTSSKSDGSRGHKRRGVSVGDARTLSKESCGGPLQMLRNNTGGRGGDNCHHIQVTY